MGNHARYEIVVNKADHIYIRDLCPPDCLSVTNDAEYVVKTILSNFGNKKIFYKDTSGCVDELAHDGKKFVEFLPGGNYYK